MGQPWLAEFSLLADLFLELFTVLDTTVTWLFYSIMLLSGKINGFDSTDNLSRNTGSEINLAL